MPTQRLYYPALVNSFYAANHLQAALTLSPAAMSAMVKDFRAALDSCYAAGLDKNKYHYAELSGAIPDSELVYTNPVLFDAIIAYCKDLQGMDIAKQLDDDQLSPKYAAASDTELLQRLSNLKTPGELLPFLSSFEPASDSYTALKNELKAQVANGDKTKVKQVAASLNFLRWIGHFHFPQYIVVNIADAHLDYFQNGKPVLSMKAVVGKTATKTPFFSAYCNQVILYPYWNVPKKIAVKELVPKFAKSPGEAAKMNIEVVGDDGKVIAPESIDWAQYSGSDFPYTLRQQTGCSNSLGVIKFNLTDPFDVYLHDTNFKSAFDKDSRYLSHGCIRLEKPLDLANYLLNNKVDESLVLECRQDQKPIVNVLPSPVPVFVVYMTAVAEDDSVRYYKDIYHIY